MMKNLYLLLLLSTACGRIGVYVLPGSDASVSVDGGKPLKSINTHEGTVLDAGVSNDASIENDASADASVQDTGVGDSGVSTPDATIDVREAGIVSDASVVVNTSLNGDWIVQLARTGGNCTDAVSTYEDLWTIENESELHSLDYDLVGVNGTFSAVYVNAKVSVTVSNLNGALTGTHKLDALNMNGTVRCTVMRSVRGVRD